MQAFGEAFYGRAAAYDLALTAGEEPLAQALCKNILNGQGIENARRLALYAKAVIAALAGLDEATLQNASSIQSWKFPSPLGLSTQS
jgi:cytochrome b pre-mRNA-processing protein 3